MSTLTKQVQFDGISDDFPSPVCSCLYCKHYTGPRKCKAFPDKVPDEIWNGENEHTDTFQGDKGIIFDPIFPNARALKLV